jgi:Leucine-rich repeat (LRR) protein
MDEKELISVINQCKRSGATKLDLSDKQLISLPSEIGDIVKLQELNLSMNKLKTLPQGIWKL